MIPNVQPPQNIKDQSIDLMIQTKKQIYIGGEFLEGVVHLNCKSLANYQSLRIVFESKQFVCWTQARRRIKVPLHNSNSAKTYMATFDLALFNNGIINPGQYSFPFKFLLSSEFPGSFCILNQYIRYFLSTQLVALNNPQMNQSSTIFVNIIEPHRKSLEPVSAQLINKSVGQFMPGGCCCKSNGDVKITMKSDKNFVRPGDTINIQGFIDNTTGKTQIKNIKAHFYGKSFKISSSGNSKNTPLLDQICYTHPNSIPAGGTDKFVASITIPKTSTISTCIGTIFAFYHSINIQGQMGGYFYPDDKPSCELIITYKNETPKVENQAPIQLPSNWQPLIYPQIVNTSMPPYIYNPHVKMRHLNRRGNQKQTTQTTMNNLNNMNNMSPIQPLTSYNSQNRNQYKITSPASNTKLMQNNNISSFEYNKTPVFNSRNLNINETQQNLYEGPNNGSQFAIFKN